MIRNHGTPVENVRYIMLDIFLFHLVHKPVDARVDVSPEHRQEEVDGHWGLKGLHRPLQQKNFNSSIFIPSLQGRALTPNCANC